VVKEEIKIRAAFPMAQANTLASDVAISPPQGHCRSTSHRQALLADVQIVGIGWPEENWQKMQVSNTQQLALTGIAIMRWSAA
jgi:hypothetical protein